jgi:hypothetical protein
MDPTQAAAEQLQEKWSPIIEHADMPKIEDTYKRRVTAILLENQETAINEVANASGTGLGLATNNSNANMQGYDPILISLVRRAMPNLIAYDVCGVQPMTGPTGLIFAMKAKYDGQAGDEALYNEARTSFGGASADQHHGWAATGTGANRGGGDPLFAEGITVGSTAAGTTIGSDYGVNPAMSTSAAENLNADSFTQMAFSIERTAVAAKTRALKAEYTTELAQDLKAVHGLDAETELANILSNEILAEINREVVRTIYVNAKLGAQQADLYYKGRGANDGFSAAPAAGNTQAAALGGIYDLDQDSDGRWSAERFRGLQFQIERECNVIAKETRRGKGNFILCSADVASALAMSGWMQLQGGDSAVANVDDTGNTFVGTVGGGKIKVYVDPYSGTGISTLAKDFVCVGYRGTSPYDAGMFYCPYVPLQMVRAVGENTFQPKIGFKTRYGMVNNPFVSDSDPHTSGAVRNNQYYRIFRIDNLHGLNS